MPRSVPLAFLIAAVVAPAAGARAAPPPPSSVAAYSDYRTPTSIRLTWVDPGSDESGSPLPDFDVRIRRVGGPIDSVAPGVGEFTAVGLVDRSWYEFELRTRLVATGEESAPVVVGWHAGGHPVPGPPLNLFVDVATSTLHWTHASVQADSTPLDDLSGVSVYRNGNFFARISRPPSMAGRSDSWKDLHPPAGPLVYELATYDREVLRSESIRSAPAVAIHAEPTIELLTPAIRASLAPDEIRTIPIRFRNVGHPALNVTASATAPWLELLSATAGVPTREIGEIGIRLRDAGLIAGSYRDTVVLATNDSRAALLRVPVELIIVDPVFTYAGGSIGLRSRWLGGRDSVEVAIDNTGHGTLRLSLAMDQAWLTANALRVDVPARGMGALRLYADPAGLDVGNYQATLRLATNDRTAREVAIPVSFTVTHIPPAIVLEDTVVALTAAREGPERRLRLVVGTAGSESLDVAFTADADWLSPEAERLRLPPRGSLETGFMIDPGALPSGTHSARLEVAGAHPERPVARLRIELAILDADPAPLSLDEMALSCGDAKGGVQFIEIVAAASTWFDDALQIELRDSRGRRKRPAFPLGRPGSGSTTWPADRSWLIADPGFANATGVTPDGILPVPLDPLGGTITVFRAGQPPTLVGELLYGLPGGPPAPGASSSLRRSLDGTYETAAPPSPRNFAGRTVPGPGCACPVDRLTFDTVTTTLAATAYDTTVYGATSRGTITVDHTRGIFYCDGAYARTQLRASDLFVLDGIARGTPVALEARLRLTGRLVAMGRSNSVVTGKASLRQGTAVVAGNWRTDDPFRVVDEVLTLALPVAAGEPFLLEVDFAIESGSFDGFGRLGGDEPVELSFAGVPAGAVLRSCKGYDHAGSASSPGRGGSRAP